MSTRQTARKVKAAQQSPQIVAYANGLIALGEALKNPQTSIRELARLSLEVGLRLDFGLTPLPPTTGEKP